MAEDVGADFSTRGPTTVGQTPALTALGQQLTTPGLGADPGRKQQCHSLVIAARAELGQADTMVAALDDVVAAAQDLATPAETSSRPVIR